MPRRSDTHDEASWRLPGGGHADEVGYSVSVSIFSHFVLMAILKPVSSLILVGLVAFLIGAARLPA